MEKKINKGLAQIPKKYASRYLKLKIRHRVVEIYLAKIKVIETL